MVLTPWGDAEELRERKLPPGRATPREEVLRNQRERLFAALVAAVAAKGYEATSVADLVEVSGVSRATFYEHFADKRACFEAATEAIVAAAVAIVSRRCAGPAGAEAKARAALECFVDLIVAQPAAARLCFVEAYAAGAGALGPVESAVDGFAELIDEVFAEIPGREGMPAELIRGMIGGVYKVFHTRLYRGEVEAIPALAPRLLEWALAYDPPPQPLRRGRRARAAPSSPPPFAAHDPAERIVRAFAATAAERGYPATGITEVMRWASMSQSTFYEHFEGKEEAMLAALDSSGAQMLAATMPAVRRSSDWPSAVRTAYAAMCGFMAAEPGFAHLRAVEVYAAGPAALEMRDATGQELLEALTAPRFEGAPEVEPIVLEAISGAIYSLVYDQVRTAGPRSLPEIVPLATYIALAPLIGAEEACAVANGDGRGR